MDNLTELFQLFSDSTRLRILLLLLDNELCVCQMMGALGMSQPRISQQLAILKRSKLLTSNRMGKWMYYKISPDINNDYVITLLQLVKQWLSSNDVFESDRNALRACMQQQEATGRCDLEIFKGISEKVDAGFVGGGNAVE